MKKLLSVVLLTLLIAAVVTAEEAKFSVSKDDTIRSVLSKQVGAKVTLRLGSGDEIGGTVKSVGDRVVHLSEITGKEFFDAAVDIDKINAVMVRAR